MSRQISVARVALEAVTQKAQASDQNSIVLEPLPEADRRMFFWGQAEL